MRGGSSQTYPAFDKIEDQLGYNPARFLDHDDDATIGETSDLALAKARIRGIEDVATIRAWLTVETALDRGPRQQVIAWLNHRQATLQDTEAHETETTLSDPDECATAEAETASDDDTVEPPTQPASPSGTTTTSPEATVATDGGTEPPADPTCSECGEDLIEDEVAGTRCHWCPTCADFRNPATTPTSTESTEDEESEATADTAAELPKPPRCPDCRGTLTREEAGDEVAYWCSPCGGFKEPLDAMEATT